MPGSCFNGVTDALTGFVNNSGDVEVFNNFFALAAMVFFSFFPILREIKVSENLLKKNGCFRQTYSEVLVVTLATRPANAQQCQLYVPEIG